MFLISVIVGVKLENSMDEFNDLFIAFVEVRCYASMQDAGKFVLLEIPVIYAKHKKLLESYRKHVKRNKIQ